MNYFLFLSSVSLFGISMCFTPGPNNALAMATGLDKGFKAALPFCFGAGAGANLTLLLLGFGLGEIFSRFPLVYDALRYMGAAYMLWLAICISGLRLPRRSGQRGQPAGSGIKKDKNGGNAARNDTGIRPLTFFQAVALQLVNVKVWLTNIIVVSSYIGTGDGFVTRFCIVVALFSFMGTSAMCLWAAGGAFMRRFLTSGGMRRANYIFALFLVFSIILLFVQPK